MMAYEFKLLIAFIASQIAGYLVPMAFVVDGALLPEVKKKLYSDFMRNCDFDHMCGHGKCNNQTGLCHCVQGWKGRQCDISANGTQFKPMARNDWLNSAAHSLFSNEYYGVKRNSVSESLQAKSLKRIKSEADSSLQEQLRETDGEKHPGHSEEKHSAKKDIQETRDKESRHVCLAAYETPNLKARMCLPGLICTFGSCSSNNHISYLSFECACDKGAIGIFCEHKCCLECGDHGQCALYTNGTEFCDCAFNFHGEKCDLAKIVDISEQSTSLHHRKLPMIIIVGLSVIAMFLLLAVVGLMLILRERGCTALFVVPSSCKHEPDCSHGRSRSSDDVVVYYHRNLSGHRLSCPSLSPHPLPLPLHQKPACPLPEQEKDIGIGSEAATCQSKMPIQSVDDSLQFTTEPT